MPGAVGGASPAGARGVNSVGQTGRASSTVALRSGCDGPFHGLPAAHRARISDDAPVVGTLARSYVRRVARLQRDRWRSAPRSGCSVLAFQDQ